MIPRNTTIPNSQIAEKSFRLQAIISGVEIKVLQGGAPAFRSDNKNARYNSISTGKFPRGAERRFRTDSEVQPSNIDAQRHPCTSRRKDMVTGRNRRFRSRAQLWTLRSDEVEEEWKASEAEAPRRRGKEQRRKRREIQEQRPTWDDYQSEKAVERAGMDKDFRRQRKKASRHDAITAGARCASNTQRPPRRCR